MAHNFELSSMQVVHPKKEPELAQTMAFATRAGAAALLLYRRIPGTMEPRELAPQEQAQAHYMASVVDLANRGQYATSMNDLQYLSLAATFRRDAGAPPQRLVSRTCTRIALVPCRACCNASCFYAVVSANGSVFNRIHYAL